eukprot:CAMPEP_0113631120 /NCGR_PEP_ID=MMETSP0017_2-20120614/16173_1 /TAXON_ID=2856 /ORGANISM="Cylindrotheca closterium" /LENGTH=170 /DNA_ID=CAMNT_0000541619 /DNA_START=70 /DNA_END=582 /DNA_ORIENTATION=+ /assembly_acc=CAM_ASM_000147
MIPTSVASRQCRSLAFRRMTNRLTSRSQHKTQQVRRWQSSSEKPEDAPPPTVQNLALASVLAGFTFFVFTYSMNAVGRSDEESDPLAQLKEEAQEARQSKANEHKKRLSPEEIAALESGMTGAYDKNSKVEVAVAAPAEIAELEEQANMKVFQSKQGGEQKKKPWWRFGF